MIKKTTRVISRVSSTVGIYALFMPSPPAYPITAPLMMNTKKRGSRIAPA